MDVIDQTHFEVALWKRRKKKGVKISICNFSHICAILRAYFKSYLYGDREEGERATPLSKSSFWNLHEKSIKNCSQVLGKRKSLLFYKLWRNMNCSCKKLASFAPPPNRSKGLLSSYLLSKTRSKVPLPSNSFENGDKTLSLLMKALSNLLSSLLWYALKYREVKMEIRPSLIVLNFRSPFW